MSKIHWFPMLAVFLCLSFLSSLLCSLSHMGDNLSKRLFSRFPFLRNVERPSRKNRLIICLFYFDFLFLFILSFSLFLSQECRETEQRQKQVDLLLKLPLTYPRTLFTWPNKKPFNVIRETSASRLIQFFLFRPQSSACAFLWAKLGCIFKSIDQ